MTPVIFILLTIYALVASAVAQQQPQTTPQPAEMPEESKRFALIIGVSKYEDTGIVSLDGPDNDARQLKQALRMSGFDEDNIIVLASDQPSERQPTRPKILKQLFGLKDWVDRDGLLVIAFSGHGFQPPGSDEVFLLPSDVQFSADPSLLKETAVPLSKFHDAVKETKVKQVIFLVDACRDSFRSAKGPNDPIVLTKAYSQTLAWDQANDGIEAFATLYATDEGHPAYIYKEKHQGYFSYVLIDGLVGKAKDDKSRVTLSSLEAYLEKKVPELVKRDYGKDYVQKPHAMISGYRANDLLLRTISDRDKSLSYMISATLTPAVEIPNPISTEISHDDTTDDCTANLDKAVSLCLDASDASDVTGTTLSEHATCSSSKVSRIRTDETNKKCVVVDYHLQSCTDAQAKCIKPALSFTIALKGAQFSFQPQQPFTLSWKAFDGSQYAVTIQYPGTLPVHRGIRWAYDATVLHQSGNDVFQSTVTSDKPQTRGVRSDISDTGALSLELEDALKIWQGINVVTDNSNAKPPAH